MNTKETKEKIDNYIWKLESDCIAKAMDSKDFTEKIKHNYSADMLTKVRMYIKELI